MPIEDLHHIQLAMPAGEEEAARRFYGDVLGMTERPKPEPLRRRGGVWFTAGATEMHLGVEADFRPARKAHPAFRVSDLAALRARLEAAGCATREDEPLPGFQRFYADDPFGNRLEFLQPD